MQIETRTTSPSKADVASPPMIKRRVRTDAGRMARHAEQRRSRANTMVVVSALSVLALVKIFYVLLTR